MFHELVRHADHRSVRYLGLVKYVSTDKMVLEVKVRTDQSDPESVTDLGKELIRLKLAHHDKYAGAGQGLCREKYYKPYREVLQPLRLPSFAQPDPSEPVSKLSTSGQSMSTSASREYRNERPERKQVVLQWLWEQSETDSSMVTSASSKKLQSLHMSPPQQQMSSSTSSPTLGSEIIYFG